MKIFFKAMLAVAAITPLVSLGTANAGSKLKHHNSPASLSTPVVAPPAISYGSTAQVGRVGVSISPVTPVNTGGAVPTLIYHQKKVVAGGTLGQKDGTGTAASFRAPRGYASDAAGNIFVADSNKIRKITPAGVVSTFAGSGAAGYQDGTGIQATFNGPQDIVIDAAGNLFVADAYNYGIRKITPQGVVTRFAGSGTIKLADGTGSSASFISPQHMAIDPSGNIYVSENSSYLRKITPAGVVTTINMGYGAVYDIAADKSGYLYIIAAIQRFDPNTVVAKMLPSGVQSYSVPVYGAQTLAVSPANDVYVAAIAADYINKLYKVSSAGITETLLSNLAFGANIGIDAAGSIYTDDYNGAVYKVPTYGYGISPALPPGLGINALGVITGKPLMHYPPTLYKVTAYNAGGASSTTVTITVKAAIDAPAITVPATATFTAGVAISAITPANAGGAVPAGIFGNVTTLAGNFTMGVADGTGSAASLTYPMGLTCDAAGNVYVAESGGQRIRKITPVGVVTTFAGHSGDRFANGQGAAAAFWAPKGVTIDLAGNLYVADEGNNLVRKITPDGNVTIFAGRYPESGAADGTSFRATFTLPHGIGIDYLQNIYVTEQRRIRKITPEAVVTTLSTGELLKYPNGIKTDVLGNLYIADGDGNTVIKISKTGVASQFAGSGNAGAANGKGTAATFNNPYDVALDESGNVYVADFGNNEVRMVTAAGVVTTLAGGTAPGTIDGIGAAAMFSQPAGLALDGKGHLYVSDFSNHVIRKIDITGYTISPALPAGLVFNGRTGAISGTPVASHKAATYTITAHNGSGMSSANITITINVPPPLVAPALNYTYDNSFAANTAITPLSPNNTGDPMPSPALVAVTNFAGSGQAGAVNGAAATASFHLAAGAICFDPSGNMYVADGANNIIRKVTPAGDVSTFAGSGVAGSADGTGGAARFKGINGIAADKSGNLFVCDALNNKIRKITPAGVVTTFAGSGSAASINGTGVGASFTALKCIAIDKNNVLYVNDNGNIMAISAAAVVTNKTYGNFLSTVSGIAPDAAGNIYLALSDNYIKKIDIHNEVTTFAGHGTAGADDGSGTSASFNNPKGIAVDVATGNIYLADAGNNKIRMVTPAALVSTFAGSGSTALTNGAPLAAGFSNPISIAFDNLHNPYIADGSHNVIRKIATTGYHVLPVLPAGLSLNSVSGIITGTPTAASAKAAYIVTAYNSGGTGVDSLWITVTPAALQKMASLYDAATDSINMTTLLQPVVSAGLSPNGDGINDVLIINNIERFPKNKLTIFNNSGVRIFETENYDNTGNMFAGRTERGTLQPRGTYFYDLNYTDGSLVKHKTGYIVLKY